MLPGDAMNLRITVNQLLTIILISSSMNKDLTSFEKK
jgi:hypothetical protein